MRPTIILSWAVLASLVCAGALLANDTAAAGGPPAMHHYIIILKTGKAPLPDIAALGGTLQDTQAGMMFVTLPDPAVEALRKHERVKYIQVTLLPNEKPPARPAAAASSGLAAAPQSEPHFAAAPNGNLTWSTGTYLYDGMGNVAAIGTPSGSLNSDGKANSYVYDVMGRLVQGSANYAAGNYSQSYTYDPYGNITEVDTTDPSGGPYAMPISVSAGTNRLNSAQAAYDAAGNLTADGTNYARFDSLSMMTYKSAGGGEQYYLYDAMDQRIGVKESYTFWTWTFRDEAGLPLRDFRSWAFSPYYDWLWLEDYAYRDGRLLAAERVPEEGGRRDFHLDHLGTPRLETGPNGGLIARHDYLPYGKEITSIRQELDEGYDRIDPPHFTGHERDFASTQSSSADSSDYMHARYYDTAFGRFYSADPVTGRPDDPRTWNRYAYVLGNPMTFNDPTGTVENGQPCNTAGIGTPCLHPRPLSEADLTKIARDVLKSAPKNATPFELANRLIKAAGDFTATGKAILGALSAVGVTLPKEGVNALSGVSSMTVKTVDAKRNIKQVTVEMKEFHMALPIPHTKQTLDLQVGPHISAEVATTNTTVNVQNLKGLSTILGTAVGVDAHLVPNFQGHRAIEGQIHLRGFGIIPIKPISFGPYPIP